MFRPSVEPQPTELRSVLSGSCRITRRWPGLKVEYAWLPPFAGHSVTKPDRLEVVFSAHSGVALELGQRVHDVNVVPGAMYVVGAEPTTLLKVGEYSDTLEMYPDFALLSAAAERENIHRFALEPTWQGQRSVTFRRDATVLGVAHLLRRACMGQLTLPDIEASSLTHLLAQRLLATQYGALPSMAKARGARLDARLIASVADYIEDHLAGCITLDELAAIARLSPFHFARSFKRSTGLAPSVRAGPAHRVGETADHDDTVERSGDRLVDRIREPELLPAAVRGATRRAARRVAPSYATMNAGLGNPP